MKKLQVAFFKGEGSPISKAVRLVTNGTYSHTELVLGNKWYGSNIVFFGKSGIAVVTRPRIKKSEWDFIDIEVENAVYKAVERDLIELLGSGYDWTGIFFTQLLDFNINSDGKYFCSEMVAYVLIKNKVLRMHSKSAVYSPALLYKEFNNKLKYTPINKRIMKVGKISRRAVTLENKEIYSEW